MSNDKPTSIATIKFYPNKHVEVELSSIRNITPRTLDIASNILLKTYRGNKAKFIAGEHRKAREDAAQKEIDDAKAAKKFDDEEAKRLEIATAKALGTMPKVETKVEVKTPVATGPATVTK